MSKSISSERKAAYYLGTALVVIGFLSFFSVFVTGAMNFGDFSNFEGEARSSMTRALVGMGLLIAGGIVRTVGARGLAGSGVVLDPEQACEELEPYSRMAGGIAKDALDEAGLDLGSKSDAESASGKEPVVMLRCTSCKKLNEEDSKFCQECGAPI